MCVSVGLEQSSKANCLHVAGVNGGGGGSTPGTGQMGRGGGSYTAARRKCSVSF